MREKDQIAKCESELYALPGNEGLVQRLLAILIRYLLKIHPAALQLLQPVPVQTVGTSLGRCQRSWVVASRFEWLYLGCILKNARLGCLGFVGNSRVTAG
ncbi:MAG: hypothetical protein CMJ81_10155 [Planctomycetaceae bacterium]|nr:hypothetical protein [Planctomycetaceae bacterium]MBP60053.1 hypothetical protein [Planctomycetaceae bacterium]